MPLVSQVAQSPEADAIVSLYTLDASHLGAGVFRFVSAADPSAQPITNLVRNPWFVGAVSGTPGTLPLETAVVTASGSTRSVVQRGVDDGLPFVDIRWFGSVASGSSCGLWFSAAGTEAIEAVSGQQIAYGAYASIVAGTWDGVFTIMRQRFDADGVSQGIASWVVDTPTGGLRANRVTRSEAVPSPDTRYVRFGLFARFDADQAIDITFRFGAPQLQVDTLQLGGLVLPPRDTFGPATLSQRVRYQGFDYEPLPIEADGFAWTGRGAPPRPKLRVSNIGGIFGPLLLHYNDLIGARLTRIRTFRRFLDGQPQADPFAHFQPDVWRVERKVRHDHQSIEWELASVLEQEGRKLPARQMLRDVCTHVYRRWTGDAFDYSGATCPYIGDDCFDETGTATTQDKDRCGKRLSDCQIRFGQGAILPTRAFPGIGRV